MGLGVFLLAKHDRWMKEPKRAARVNYDMIPKSIQQTEDGLG
jgi:hypothetical protein